MNGQLTVEATVQFGRGMRNERIVREGSPPELPRGRVPRIARLMALAIRFDELIRTGRVKNQLQLAKLGGVTRQHVTQIMNMLLLAPDIQEAMLTLSRVERGKEAVNLKGMQAVARVVDWREQCQQSALHFATHHPS